MTDQVPQDPAGVPEEGTPASGPEGAEDAEGTGGTEGTEGVEVPDDLSGIEDLPGVADPADPADPADLSEADGEAPQVDELMAVKAELAERTTDLQRERAEYVNYRARVKRDGEKVREDAKYQVLAPIVEVLDTIDRAREHGELDGGFKAVAEQLERTVSGLGLTKFGEVGDAFDPTRHDALSHLGTDAEVTVPTCKVIAKAGYTIGDRVVRAAQVLVVDPAE